MQKIRSEEEKAARVVQNYQKQQSREACEELMFLQDQLQQWSGLEMQAAPWLSTICNFLYLFNYNKYPKIVHLDFKSSNCKSDKILMFINR